MEFFGSLTVAILVSLFLIFSIGIYFYFLPSRLVIKNLFFYRIKFSAIFSNPLIILPPDSIDANKLC